MANHVDDYIEEIKEKEESVPNVKGLLIINTQRDRKPDERDPVGQDQIKLAERENVLIITTVELLDLYERFKLGEINCDPVIKAFSELRGLFSNQDIS